MSRLGAKFVLRLIIKDYKGHRVEVCRQFLEQASDNEASMQNIITGEENWV